MFSKSICAMGALAFMTSTTAHMIMSHPTPYGYSTLQTSPLNGDGYNFPCQSGSRADAFDADGASNPMTVGEANELKFTGSAVHGGGSCQLSVTYDDPPPADKSKWKVIHSFIGSCPAQAAGNLVADPQYTDPDQRPSAADCTGDDQTECLKVFQFQLPEGMKNGNATLAWTWLNKLGNREYYMNCAPISISGGSDDDTVFDSLPELFVANIPGECTTEEGVFNYPNPGEYVTYGEAVTPGANGGCPAGSSSGSSGSSSSAAASPYATSAGTAVSSYAAATASADSSAGLSVGVSLSIDLEQNGRATATAAAQSTTLVTMSPSDSAPAAEVTSTTSAYVAQAYPTAASASAAASSTGNGTCDSGKVSCPTPGAIMCIGDAQFGLCNIDYCAVPEALAAGTTCSSGVISKRDIVRRSSSRFHRRGAGHVHKHSF